MIFYSGYQTKLTWYSWLNEQPSHLHLHEGKVEDWQLLILIKSGKNHMNKCLTFSVGKEQLVFSSKKSSPCDNHLFFLFGCTRFLTSTSHKQMHCSPEGRTFRGRKVAKMTGENMTIFAHQNQICCPCICQHGLLKLFPLTHAVFYNSQI